MVMSGYKVTMFIQQGRFGGSETHYDASNDPVTARNNAIRLTKLRIGLMPASVSMFAVRFSNTAPPFDSDELDPANYANAPKWIDPGTIDTTADQAKAALQVRISIGRKRAATTYVFGTPDIALGDESKTIPQRVPASWLNAWNAYAAELTTTWGTRGIVLAAGGNGPFPVVAHANDAGTGRLQVAVAGQPAALAVGASVFLRKFTRINTALQSANGPYVITLVQANTPAAGQTQYTLSSKAKVDSTTIITDGTIEIRDFQRVPYANPVILWKMTTRKRGNRFLAGLGRRKTRIPL